MEQPHNKTRLVAIHQMLFEMARGNFHGRIPLSSHDDALETLVVLINMVAEELKASIFQIGYVNPHHTPPIISHMSLLLDDSLNITSYTWNVLSFLGYSEADLMGQPIQNFLTETSYDALRSATDAFREKDGFHYPLVLSFTTKDHLLVSVPCSMGLLLQQHTLILNFTSTLGQDSFNDVISPASEVNKHKASSTRRSDAVLIQKLYDYILAHLDDPLPSIRKLALHFGTNEFKIKEGFRYFFKTSIYKFYTEERLKRAHLMIQKTTIPLKNIASMNGYNDYPNFSKAFKKHFGYPPNKLNRPEAD